MRLNLPRTLLVLALSAGASLAGCKREQPAQPAAPAADTPAAVTPATAAVDASLQDVTEHTADYIIGISYPPVASQYPLLAAELRQYADSARKELLEAAKGRAQAGSSAPYELVLPFTELHVSPTLVSVGVDGSSYTGGAHGAPLIARWVWLPQQNRLLRASDLVADAKGWEAISTLVREQLHTALSQRVDADELPPAERVEVLKNANRMIDDGTEPDPDHFSQFEPIVGGNGRIQSVRFVFAPYQVGPYSDGTQTVEVPSASLLPYIAPAFRGLFEGG
ncbi:DUF3298 and DUF4163 domain-containing protein [Lysobacter solisilvae (ex Woo and Kim 2020)]|uniref:DUF3298 domain-containing protein n=1 Tax=Agrilutibacter terrestris TaxID=2865112 RepID=A0A7H0FXY8_9GAMM|nr:DUF3298 and DUF4163 domain-containing protein [Lysobacter terrestris]QNP40904.1 DUF3298 domain-containing protein [Lysobacter terrestris]